MADRPVREWTARVCDLGGDLRELRCHVDARCGSPGGCNEAEHYCDCRSFTVAVSSEVEGRLIESACSALKAEAARAIHANGNLGTDETDALQDTAAWLESWYSGRTGERGDG